MNNFLEENNDIEAITDIVKGMKFYIVPYFFRSRFCFCTYRNLQQVRELFGNARQIFNPHEVLAYFNDENGIFCAELHNYYKSLKTFAEDLAMSRIAGLMEKEI